MSDDHFDGEDDGLEPWRGGPLLESSPATEITPPSKKNARRAAAVSKSAKKDASIVGGFAFYLSLAALLPTGVLTVLLAVVTWEHSSAIPTGIFVTSALVGAFLAHSCVSGHISVLIHEFKHSVVSNLVGNKRKGMKVNERSGHFEYSYTKRTAHYNAFISLAPYILPLFTFICSLLAFALVRHNHERAAIVVGIGYGCDLLLNARDISPIQTDISLIRGGYKVGLLYIGAWNLVILGLLLAWVFKGTAGFVMLLEQFSLFFVKVHLYLSARTLE